MSPGETMNGNAPARRATEGSTRRISEGAKRRASEGTEKRVSNGLRPPGGLAHRSAAPQPPDAALRHRLRLSGSSRLSGASRQALDTSQTTVPDTDTKPSAAWIHSTAVQFRRESAQSIVEEIKELKRAQDEKDREIEAELEQKSGKSNSRTLHKKYIPVSGPQLTVHKYISWWPFDFSVGMIIVMNAVTIGFETENSANDLPNPMWLEVLGMFFLAVYALELFLRCYAYSAWGALISNWVKFDAFLVFCGLADIIMKLATAGSSNEVLEKVMLTRMLRLVRLARAARLIIQFKVLWQLVRGLIGSLLTVLWTFIIIGALVYIFAIVGLELIREDPEAGDAYEVASSYFQGGLGSVCITLMQFVTVDGPGEFYRPISLAKPYLVVYFISFLLLVSVVMMTLVTAVIVDTAVQQSASDKEANKAYEAHHRKTLIPTLKEMFNTLDEDGSGEIDLEEIRAAPPELIESIEEVTKMDNVEQIFKILDYDGSGSIDADEFVEGLVQAANNKPIEMLCMLRQCSAIMAASRSMEARLVDIEERLTNMVPKGKRAPPSDSKRESAALV